MEVTYSKPYFHESHVFGYWCHMGLNNHLILQFTDLAKALSSYVAPEDTPALTLESTSGDICCFAML